MFHQLVKQPHSMKQGCVSFHSMVDFHQLVKMSDVLKKQVNEQEILRTIKSDLDRLLQSVPFVEIQESLMETKIGDKRVDLAVRLRAVGQSYNLLVECKSVGEPRIVRMAIQQLREYSSLLEHVYPVVGAPYISKDTAALCKQNSVGYIDLAGNCYLSFDHVFIEASNYPNPAVEKRRIGTIFSPKASRILRVMLNFPDRRPWGVWELAREANVSIGLASKVKGRLLDLDYARGDKHLALSRPIELLEEWARNYSFRRNKVNDYFSFDDVGVVERELSERCRQEGIPFALTLFSGAARVAPFSRYARGFAYVGRDIGKMAVALNLKTVTSGPNFTILEPYDEGVFYRAEDVGGVRVVSDVQLYLDLVGFKGRGEEAAEFLLDQRIKPKW